MESSCRAAIAAGVTEIAFTDHVDHVPADPGYGYYQADEYLREVDRIRDQFSGELTVLRGAEIDYNEGTTEDVERFVTEYGGEFDFVIG
jgi:histidinol-phosphatase (PHP family)